MKYICVGGPWAGREVELRSGQESFIVACMNDRIDILPAWHDSSNVPHQAVTVHEAVYKVSKLAQGAFTVVVLAYYGRDAKDRPSSFHL